MITQFAIYEFCGSTRHELARVDDFDAALARIEAMGSVLVEADSDYPGCADAFLRDGRVVAVEPVEVAA